MENKNKSISLRLVAVMAFTSLLSLQFPTATHWAPIGVERAQAVVAPPADAKRLDYVAQQAVRAPWAERTPGWCSRFVRQIHEISFPAKAAWLRANLFGAHAMATARLWRNMGYSKTLAQVNSLGGLRAGDVLFQEYGSGGYGHVGIVVNVLGKLYVSENTTRNGNRWDGRAVTPLSRFGGISSVGRLGGFGR